MLDLKTCKALKAAGMPWEPKLGDMFYTEAGYIDAFDATEMNDEYEEMCNLIEKCKWAFAPRLDDLLARIEAEGYIWKLRNRSDSHYFIKLLRHNGKGFIQCYHEEASSPVQAAAASYLWILQAKNKEAK